MTINTGKYCWNANEYTKNSSNPYEWAKELIPKLELKGTESVLDIGCGEGKVTALLASYLPHGQVVGVDSSEDMITAARSAFPHCHYPNLTFLRMDIRELTFREQFDVAFSNAALHWIIDHQAVLECVHDSLDKGGRLLFQMAGKGNAQNIIAVLEELISEEDCKPYFKNFTFPYGFYGPEEYTKWLKEAGFKPERLEMFPKDMKLHGKEALLGWIKSVWLPFTERVPENLRDSFINELADRYLAAYPMDSSSIVHVNMVRLEVQATKL
ncbi:MAG: methyltransferase domain-containing protein [Candidatus Bathyarchaeota archaeon]|nr:methyltransferase domain-containing protein [Candidatus Bathyarchaeota archaeon]